MCPPAPRSGCIPAPSFIPVPIPRSPYDYKWLQPGASYPQSAMGYSYPGYSTGYQYPGYGTYAYAGHEAGYYPGSQYPGYGTYVYVGHEAGYTPGYQPGYWSYGQGSLSGVQSPGATSVSAPQGDFNPQMGGQ
jgi:hypothetical protein